MAKQFVCTSCGFVGRPEKVWKGSFWVELFLWLLFIVPGLIYSIWRLTSKYDACPACKQPTMIPTDTPTGQKLTSRSEPKPTTVEEQAGRAVYCTACGKPNHAGAAYCFACGHKLQAVMNASSGAGTQPRYGLIVEPDARHEMSKKAEGTYGNRRESSLWALAGTFVGKVVFGGWCWQRIVVGIFMILAILMVTNSRNKEQPTQNKPNTNISTREQGQQPSPEQKAKMSRMSDSQLLNEAHRLLLPRKTGDVFPSSSIDAASMYLHEFDRRHPHSENKPYQAISKRLAGVLVAHNVEENHAEMDRKLDANPPNDLADIICRDSVKNNLKAPSTAKFQSFLDDYIGYQGKGKFEVQTKVDAENSFGAMLRSTFDCKVQCVDGEHCAVASLKEL